MQHADWLGGWRREVVPQLSDTAGEVSSGDSGLGGVGADPETCPLFSRPRA